MSKITRQITQAESQFLKEQLSILPNKQARRKEAIENFMVMVCVVLLGFILVWLFIAWLAMLVLGVNVGLKSDYNLFILGVLTFLSVVYSAKSTAAWLKEWQDPKPALEADIQAGKVTEENFTIIDAKRFQEPEHGGLIYFLKVQGKSASYVIYDGESQDLGAQQEDPFDSPFRVKCQLKVVTAPVSKWIVESSFSGAELPVNETTEIWIHPDKWAKPDSWCDVPWNDLEKYFYGDDYTPERTLKN